MKNKERVSTQLKGTWWQFRWVTIVGSLGNKLATRPKFSTQTLAIQLSHKTLRSHLIPLASWPALSCGGNVRMLAVQLVFLMVAVQAAMARDLCQLGECKCNGLVASCSGQDIKVKDEIICI